MIKKKQISFKDLLNAKQKEMMDIFDKASYLNHPGAKGNEIEELWIKWFNNNFPDRYKAEKTFVVDCDGNISDEIDIVIYDAYYSPIIFNFEKSKFIPSESVYAVFEVKPDLNREKIIYACDKINSVKKLKRTSAPINTINGFQRGKEPFNIIGGLLTIKTKWKNDNIIKNIKNNLEGNQCIDFICCLSTISCEIKYDKNNIDIIDNENNTPLIFSYFKLLRMLQDLGNVPAIEYSKYGIEGIEPKIK